MCCLQFSQLVAKGMKPRVGKGTSSIESGIEGWRVTGTTLAIPYFLALKAEALYLADRTSEALETINEAEAMAERREERWWSAELHWLRGVFLAALSAHVLSERRAKPENRITNG